jgi:hypothetical protein
LACDDDGVAGERIDDLVRRLAAARDGSSAEANVQADIRSLLLDGDLDLDADNLVELEVQAGGGRRIDIEVGATVIETKRDLRREPVREQAEKQLADYVRARSDALDQRYVGILTDGADWRLYHIDPTGIFAPVAQFMLVPGSPDAVGLVVWLEGALATSKGVRPTPREVERRLGAASSAHALDFAELAALYAAHKGAESVQVKRSLWAKLLTTAFGTGFRDDDALFVEHTLLVAMAEIIAHAVVGLAPASLPPATLLSGERFAGAGITGVVEEDFFDWVVEVPGGERFVRDLARRLSRFAWGDVEHDVMKVLYESIISAKQRHDLGEYYTPDWLAERIVDAVVDDPLHQRVLDPACGSGTFLFWAVRRYLEAASAASRDPGEALVDATRSVIGLDVHPLAVLFARVTYLLAFGRDRLVAQGRPNIHVPVYLGDSLQWGQQQTLFSENTLTVSTNGGTLFGGDLRFPDRVLEDAGRFDRLVSELADLAAARPKDSEPPSLDASFRRFALAPEDEAMIAETFAQMCELHDTGRDHIWSYYIRNLARPAWLARDANRVDRIVGNPPWLAYRYMTAEMQAAFRTMSEQRGLWHGATVATHQDLSGLFLTRAVELYLKPEGRFGLVMPLAALTRRQYAGLRTGHFTSRSKAVAVTVTVAVAYDAPWDLHGVKPSIFPVPPSVLFGSRAVVPRPLPAAAVAWSGRLRARNASWVEAAGHVAIAESAIAETAGVAASPYARRFAQGATLVPRMLCLVEDAPRSPLGVAYGRRAVQSLRSAGEKKPWRDLPSLVGSVEEEFVRPVHLGSTIVAHRVLEPALGVIPWSAKRLLAVDDPRLDLFPGLADFCRRAATIWDEHRSSDRLSLLERLDYRHGLRDQFPAADHRVVYTKSGQYLAAARIEQPRAVIDHKLYWATAVSVDEARYLTAVLNSPVVNARVKPLQARGEHNPRDFDKYLWRLRIPMFEPALASHTELAALAADAEAFVAGLELPAGRFEGKRRHVRDALAGSAVGRAIDERVEALLDPA